MDNSVTAYAQDRKTYSLTSFLDTCVSIASASQVLEFRYFGEHIFEAFEVTMDAKLRLYLESRDKEKEQKRKIRRR